MVFPRPRAIETAGRVVGKGGLKKRVDKMFAEIERSWHHVDGYGQVIGRLATKLVPLLCGKHKPTYLPMRDMGDYVVVTNCAKLVPTTYPNAGLDLKRYYRHSGYPGGLKYKTLRQLLHVNPCEPLRRAVNGMLPKNKLRPQRMRRLHLFAGPDHIHETQFNGGAPAFRVTFADSPSGTPIQLDPLPERAESP